MATFELKDRVAVVTGGYGVLGGSMAEALGAAGARVVVLGRDHRAAEAKAEALQRAGTAAMGLVADVLDEKALVAARGALLAEWGRVDILVNAAGGHVAAARTDDLPAFEMSLPAFEDVVRLNLHGTVYPTLVFGEAMARQAKGSIVNISSMAATLALSGVLGYSVAKAAIESFTRWMAVDLARRFGAGLRVNAIAPGFFVAKQNRAALVREDGSPTERARKILARTPMGRFGDPSELQGPVLWLCGDAASFVTGAVIPVDGGFSADSGI
ncbi:MAG TPA: SDR family oxidoreductase [Vicinamibacteria bacterium]|nr:SDR family oxidoreductase [Vicinamibacteria bacterium]